MRRAWAVGLVLLLGCSADGGELGSGTGRDPGTDGLPAEDTGGGDPTVRADAGPPVDAGLDECASLELEAETTLRPVDIVWVVDSSGSMDNEAARVQENMNRFAADILAGGIDPHVVVITDSDFVTVPPPLGSDPAHYRFIERSVGSHAPLQAILDEWDSFADFLREDAVVHFVAVTDDESSVSAASFDAEVSARLGRAYTFHAIASEDIGGRECDGAADVGRHYYDLAATTDGLTVSICTEDWAAVFTELAEHVNATAPLPCEFTIPMPPEGESLDYMRVNVEFTPAGGSPALVPYVGAESSCTGTGGWFYDEPAAPSVIHLCPSSCTVVGEDTEGRVTIALGCETFLM